MSNWWLRETHAWARETITLPPLVVVVQITQVKNSSSCPIDSMVVPFTRLPRIIFDRGIGNSFLTPLLKMQKCTKTGWDHTVCETLHYNSVLKKDLWPMNTLLPKFKFSKLCLSQRRTENGSRIFLDVQIKFLVPDIFIWYGYKLKDVF